MSENTAPNALWELGHRGRMTGHGFRTLASTMLNEAGFDSALIERQLAHEEANDIKVAYDRSKRPERRRLMMQRCADMLDARLAGKVLPVASSA
jgi:integrase